MPKGFQRRRTVLLARYVQEIATVEVELDDEHIDMLEAKAIKRLEMAREPSWSKYPHTPLPHTSPFMVGYISDDETEVRNRERDELERMTPAQESIAYLSGNGPPLVV